MFNPINKNRTTHEDNRETPLWHWAGKNEAGSIMRVRAGVGECCGCEWRGPRTKPRVGKSKLAAEDGSRVTRSLSSSDR